MHGYRADYNPHKDFTSLHCWEDCKKVKQFFYNSVLPKLPVAEKYNLDSQIRKSARSTTANIAEGVGRYYFKETIQFLRISRGSLYELKDDLIFCKEQKYITTSLYNHGLILIEKAKSSINGFINYNLNQIKKQ